MIHHQPTKYHHANPLTHFLNLHTSHATAAAAAALALATDGLGQPHGHHPPHGHHAPGATSHQHLHPSSVQQHYHHHHHHQQMDGHRQLRTENEPASNGHEEVAMGIRQMDSHTDEEQDEDNEQDESSSDRTGYPGELRVRLLTQRQPFDKVDETSQEGASESENNIDVDVDDLEPREEEEKVTMAHGGGDSERNEADCHGTAKTPRAIRELGVAAEEEEDDDDDDEEIVIDGKGTQDGGHYHEPTEDNNDQSNQEACTSPCNDTNTTVLDSDGFVGKSFTIAAILGLKKKQDEAAAAAASEYSEGAMNLSTGAGFQAQQQQQQQQHHHHHHQQQQHHHQRAAAAAAVAAAAMGRLPLVMAAAAAGMEKRDRSDSVDSADAVCGGPLGYGVRPHSAGQHGQPGGAAGTGALGALQSLHQLPGLHGAGGGFSAFHPSSGNGGGGGLTGHPHQHHQHAGNHHHTHHHHLHQVNPAFGGHHFHHLQGQQQPQHQHQQQQQQQQHQQQLQQHSAHQQQQQQQHSSGGHHIALGPHHHSQNHNRDKFKDLGKKSTLSSSAASLKSKRVRTIFTPEQLERLEAEFERQQYMVGPERLYLAHTLQLTEAQVKVWFQNRRIKWRKHHLEITQQRLALIRQRQIANGVPLAANGPPVLLGQQTQQGGMSGGRMINPTESPDLTICTDSMDARSGSEGDD